MKKTIKQKVLKLKQNYSIRLFIVAVILCVMFLKMSSPFYTAKGGVEFSFDCEQNRNIEYQIFYTEVENEKFTETKSVKQIVPAGKHYVRMLIPANTIKNFRFDIGIKPGTVILSNMKIRGNATKSLSPKDFRFVQIDNFLTTQDSIIITSNKDDPLLVYTQTLNVEGAMQKDWCIFTILAIFYVFFIYRLLVYIIKFKIVEKKSKFELFFLLSFFVLSCIPILKLQQQDISTVEQRKLSSKPVFWKDGVNTKYGTEFENWISDRFFLRDFLINLYRKIHLIIAPNKGNDKVIVGHNGFFFFNDKIGPIGYANNYKYSKNAINNGVKYIRDFNEWCKQNNKKFYYFIAPDKNKIYGEYYRNINKLYDDTHSIGQVFISSLKDNYHINAWYLREDLLKHKHQDWLYWKKDTHWSPLGAYVGYLRLAEEINKEFAINFVHPEKWEYTKNSGLDLANMYHYPYAENTIYKTPVLASSENCKITPFDGRQEGIIKCQNPKGKYRVFILRDSMFRNLMPYVIPNFAYTELHWKFQVSAEDLENIKNNFDIVIVENIERVINIIFNLQFPKE